MSTEPAPLPIHIDLCGGLRVQVAGREIDTELFGGRRARWAFAHLVVGRRRPITRDELATVLWPDEVPPTWPSAVRSALTRVREVCRAMGLPADSLATDRGLVQLRLPDHVLIDLDRASDDVHRAEAIIDDTGVGTHREAQQAAERAAAVLANRVLPEVEGDWVDALRRGAHLLHIRALDALASARLALDDIEGAVDAAELAISSEPLRESSYRLLMEVHHRAGRRGDALRTYERIRGALAEELGVDPSPQTEAAYVRLLDVPAWKPDDDDTADASNDLPVALLPRDELPFVGRRAELVTLDDWWQGRSGHVRVVAVTGESGIGKSRLVREFARGCHASGARVLHGQFDRDRPSSLRPIADLLATSPTSTSLVARLSGSHAAGDDVLTDEVDRDLVLDEVVEQLAQLAIGAPLLVVLDDVQWAGHAALGVVRRLLQLGGVGIDVVATVRDADSLVDHPLTHVLAAAIREHALLRMPLGGLDAGAVGELMRSLDGQADRRARPRGTASVLPDDASRELADEVCAQAAGNPLFIGEALRHLLAAGDINVDAQGRWSGSAAAARRAPGVRGLVAARVDALGSGASDVLTVAAVIGPTFELVLLGDAVDGGLERAVDVIDGAIRAHLVRSLPERPGSCRFVHGLVHESMLDALSAPRRMALHRRVGLAMAARPGAPAAELARHFVEAAPLGELERAARYSADAAELAVRSLAYEEAAEVIARALALPIDDRGRAALLVLAGRSGIEAGDTTEANQAFLDAVEAARRAGDAVTMDRAAVLGATRGFRGGSEWMPQSERRALALEALEVVPDDEVALRTELLGQIALWTPEPVERQALARAAMDGAEADGSPDALVAAYGASRIVMWRPDDTAARIDFAARAERSAIQRGDHRLAATIAFGQLGDVLQAGRPEEVQRRLTKVADRPVVRLSRRLRWQAALWSVVTAFVEGRLDDVEIAAANAFDVWGEEPHVDALQAFGNQIAALRLLQGRGAELVDAMLEWTRANPDVRGFRTGLAWALCDAGRTNEARGVVVELLRDGLPQDNTFPIVLIGAAETVHALGDAALAAALSDLGRPLEGQLVFLPGPSLFVGPADHALGLLASTAGRHDAAVTHLQAAVLLARQCGDWWVERSQRALDRIT